MLNNRNRSAGRSKLRTFRPGSESWAALMKAMRHFRLFLTILMGISGISSCAAAGGNSSCAPPFYTVRVNGSSEHVGGCSGQYTYAGSFEVSIGHYITIDRAEWAPRVSASKQGVLSAERISDRRVRLTVKKRGIVDIFAMTSPDICGSEYRPRGSNSRPPGVSSSKRHEVRCYLLSVVGK